jgi:hypothetical protein
MSELKFDIKSRIHRNGKTRNYINFDSFDRFGDDLCQLLLSYLQIENKIEFEFVSIKWKRLIFNKQYNLEIKVYIHYILTIGLNQKIAKCSYI